jgi:polar amino acid transport system permease protein
MGGFVEAVRTTPLFVQIFFLYFGLPEIGITAPALAVATMALVIWGAAYNTENFRAAIEAVPPGFHEASRALGLRSRRMFLLVTAPIALRIALPSVTNTSVETLKNSALMLAISFPELTDVAVKMVAISFRVFEVFTTIAVTYLVLTMLLTHAMRTLERRLAWPV